MMNTAPFDDDYHNTTFIVNPGDGRDSVNVGTANLVFVISTVFWFCMSAAVTKCGKPKFVKSDVNFYRWRNIFISWLHGVLGGTWNFLCVLWYPGLLEDPVFYLNNFIYLMIPFSMGYFLYDVIDNMMNGTLLTNWEVTLHHVLVLIGFTYNWTAKVCLGYSILALMAEINSIFLHFRKLLQYSTVGYETKIYRTTSLLNLISFILCRLLPQCRILNGFYIDGHKLPRMYMVTLSIIFPPGFIINVILFWRIFKSDVLRSLKADKTVIPNKSNSKKEE